MSTIPTVTHPPQPVRLKGDEAMVDDSQLTQAEALGLGRPLELGCPKCRDKDERIKELEGALADTVKCMRLWADEEDGMPEAFYRQYVAACQLIDSRYCRVIRSGIQSCGDCMALSCGDNTNAEARAAIAKKGGAK